MGRTPAAAQRLKPFSIAFLVGFPRSGTTLADTFLMGHSDCLVLEELPLLNDAASSLGPMEGLPDVHCRLLEDARESYLEQVGQIVGERNAKVVIDKFPLNLLAAPIIHSLFPGAPVIFVQRHPCDAVLSGFMQSFEPNVGMASFLELEDAADFYDRVMRVWDASRRALDLNVHTIIYERLVADPAGTLRPIIDALGLEWDEGMLDHMSTAARRGALLNTSYNQVTEPLHRAASGRWRRYEKQLAPVLPVLLPWAERLGYADADASSADLRQKL